MTSYRRERVTRTSIEYTIEADPVWGLPWKDLYVLAHTALNEAKARGQQLCDDTVRVFPKDDEIVLRVDLEDGREAEPIPRYPDQHE